MRSAFASAGGGCVGWRRAGFSACQRELAFDGGALVADLQSTFEDWHGDAWPSGES
jgi:hypothetical protein